MVLIATMAPGCPLPIHYQTAVRQVCDKYDLPYATGSPLVQYSKAWRTIAKLVAEQVPSAARRWTRSRTTRSRQLEPGIRRD